MAEPFLAEIRIMSFQFAPKGWALCNGQLLPINQNVNLFGLLGTNYGGDGRTTFALPDLRGNVPIHMGAGHTLGERGGEQAHTLSIPELPAHSHAFKASPTNGNTADPAAHVHGPAGNQFAGGGALTTLLPATLTNLGGSQAHVNMQPYLTLSFCIALQGIAPT